MQGVAGPTLIFFLDFIMEVRVDVYPFLKEIKHIYYLLLLIEIFLSKIRHCDSYHRNSKNENLMNFNFF